MRSTLPSGTPVEIARPEVTDATTRGLVIAPDIWGMRPLFDDLTARLAAEQGWVVATVEPFPGRDLGDDIDARFAAVPALHDDDVLGDLSAAAEATGCATVSLIGFCMGGMYALKGAGLGRFHRCAAFYGMIRIPPAWRGAGQREPLDWLSRTGASPAMADHR
jgi:dienelactone hydrolase